MGFATSQEKATNWNHQGNQENNIVFEITMETNQIMLSRSICETFKKQTQWLFSLFRARLLLWRFSYNEIRTRGFYGLEFVHTN